MKKKNFLYFFIKRSFDIVLSLILIIVFSWLFLIILIINIFSTKGVPFYLDHRIGKDGKELKLYKFRSMYKDAQTHPEKYFNKEQLDKWSHERKVANDPRITKFGKFLRKTSIDEVPQIFCIFIGTMSFVGPRPIVRKEIDLNYSKEEQKIFLSAKPGLISNWGVNGRNNVSYVNKERQRLELEYFSKRSLLYDLKLMFKAIGVVISMKGAQ